ncbi:leucine-rich repeat extensin-like protein 7 [Iris pallida]|uniref:Leucine-rich repeat extensin-like protein 7 n=1 Tax=Iris pallida TaxID=29817 RepID=A0AAX6H4A1_IRIPA|nr:leucine-rich repeat extensin-like protein 7 [Iris pallida]
MWRRWPWFWLFVVVSFGSRRSNRVKVIAELVVVVKKAAEVVGVVSGVGGGWWWSAGKMALDEGTRPQCGSGMVMVEVMIDGLWPSGDVRCCWVGWGGE